MGETIFAVSSAPGRAGVAVVRVSGPHAGAALEALAGGLPPPRMARLARLRDPAGGEVIDRAIVLWFPGPRSFTGEDVAELHLHGGRAVIAAAMGALAARPGLRPAEAGEFARRAFDRGKLDLSEVEGLADLIDAQSEAQRRQALRQMDGGLSRRVEAWRTRLVRALAHLEAGIDFVEEDLPGGLEDDVRRTLRQVQEEIRACLDDDRRGERVRDGLEVAIVGPPNVGKSSLLNALARREAAIVADLPGTTRDVIEVAMDLGGYPVTLVDTAGLGLQGRGEGAHTGHGAVAAEGMRRARVRSAAADLKLVVFDLRDGPAFPAAAVDLVDERALVVLNKADLATGPALATVAGRPALTISATRGDGLTGLIVRLEAELAARLETPGEAAVVTRARHRAALEACAGALVRGLEAADIELTAEDVRLGVRFLGRIAGRVDVEDVLDAVFRDFCIGK